MGKGGFLKNNLSTIILLIVLIALAVVVFWVFKTDGLEGCRKKPKPEPPGKITMIQDLRSLKTDIAVIADLSWKKLT